MDVGSLYGEKLMSSKREEHAAQYSLVQMVVCETTHFHQRVLQLMLPSLLKANLLHVAFQHPRLSLAASKFAVLGA